MGIKIRNRILIFALILFSSAGFVSCGLDTFYVLKGPYNASHAPLTSTLDANQKYFEFYTNEIQNNSLGSDFKFEGTAIYYKIYTNTDTLNSHDSAISSVNNESNYNTAAERMISSYGYKQLGTSSGNKTPLIAFTGSDKRITIRLTDYNARNALNIDPIYSPYIKQDGSLIDTPTRVEDKHTFDFGRSSYDSNSPVPVSGDEDFEAGLPKENKYYVNMYAVAVGHDVTYKTYYSTVLHLGAITIDSSQETN